MTRLYFHATNNAQTGLPTVEQSSLTVDNNGDLATKNRLMDTTIGVTENTIDCPTSASTSAQVCHFTRFVSKPFANTSISANTWTYVFAAEEDNVNANFPCSGTGKNIWVTVYVWDPNAGSKVGNIIDAVTATGNYDEPSASATPTVVSGTFAGSAVNSIPSGCVLVYECMFQITQNNATARTITFHYDGNTVDTTSGDSPVSMASFIETPQTITFQTNAVKSINATLTISGVTAPTRRKGAVKLNAASITITGPSALNLLRKKNRSISTTLPITSSVSEILAHNIVKVVPTETITIGSTPTVLKSRVRKLTEALSIVSTAVVTSHPYRAFRNIFENIAISNIANRKTTKRRSIDA